MKQINLKCEVCGEGGSSVFCALAGSHLAKFEQEKIEHKYEKGQVIFYEGSPSYAVHYICSGLVKLYKIGPKGEELIVKLIGPGEITGYRSLLAGEPCAATAQALEPTTICTISKQTFIELLKQSPDLALRLLSKMAKDLREAEEQSISLAQESVRQRTAHLLLFLIHGTTEKAKPNGPVKIQVKRKDMAQMIGTSPESLSRTLNELVKKGILRLTRSEIYIQNLSALQRIAPESNLT